MRYVLLNIALALTVFLGSVSVAYAEGDFLAAGEFLEGCLELEGNEQLFRKTTVNWIADSQGETIIVYSVVNVEGKAAVCGFYINEGSVPQSDLKISLSKGEIKVGRQTMIRNVSYFKNACNGGGCTLCAPCFMTSLDWKSAYSKAKLNLFPTENFQLK